MPLGWPAMKCPVDADRGGGPGLGFPRVWGGVEGCRRAGEAGEVGDDFGVVRR